MEKYAGSGVTLHTHCNNKENRRTEGLNRYLQTLQSNQNPGTGRLCILLPTKIIFKLFSGQNNISENCIIIGGIVYILKERLTVHSFFLISHKSTFEDLRCSESFLHLAFCTMLYQKSVKRDNTSKCN